MKTLTLVTALAVMVGCNAAPARAQSFSQRIAADASSRWQPWRTGGRFSWGRPVLGGLGFDVTVEGWPRLLQRGFLDVHNPQNDNREVYRLAGWCDLGVVRTSPEGEPAEPELVESNWTTRRYRAGQGPQALEYVLTRLSPAVVFETASPQLDLFAGRKESSTRPIPGGIIAWRRMEDQIKAPYIPAQAAYVGADGLRVVNVADGADLSDMAESWMLLWYGAESPFFRTTIPNVLWAGDLNEIFVEADLPVLVVFQHRPRSMAAEDDSVRLRFGPDGAGAVSLLPIDGLRRRRATETARWAEQLPDELVQRCRTWARRLKAVPVAAEVSSRCSADGDAVTIRQQFEYLSLPDEWGTDAERIAPIPPAAGLGLQYGLDVLTVNGEPVAMPVNTHSGPYTGLGGTDAVELTVTGLNRYLRSPQPTPVPDDERAAILAAELEEMIERMHEAGYLAPALTLDRKHVFRIRMHFADPGETMLALGEACEFLDDQHRTMAAAFARVTAEQQNPVTTGGVPNFEGSRREYFPVVPLEQQREIIGNLANALAHSGVTSEQQANSVYGLALIGELGGDWSLLEENWTRIRQAADTRSAAEWATCGYVRGPGDDPGGPISIGGDNRGAVSSGNGQFARYVGLVRAAEHMDDAATADFGRYMLARTMLLRFAQQAVLRHMYDADFQTVEMEPDWMFAFGGSRHAPLFVVPWAGAEDETRAVIRWDEFGPAISHMFGSHWYPIFPHFQYITAECGAFLAEHARPRTQRFVDAIEANAPHWYINQRQSYVGKETWMDSPRNGSSIFLGRAYALNAPAEAQYRWQDAPFVRVGDLYQIRRIVANLRAFAVEEGAAQ